MCLISFGFKELNEQEFNKTLIEMPAYIVACLIIFYILQKRELKSFVRERNANIKQEQVTQIFNTQSDAIVVVKQVNNQDLEGV